MSFEKEIRKYRDDVNEELKRIIKREKAKHKVLDIAYKSMSQYVLNGGKRLRPIAMIKAYESITGQCDKILFPAAGIELLHNSTLCHDDIMDEDTKRRNIDSSHKAMQKHYLEQFREKEYRGDIFSSESSRFGVSVGITMGNLFNYLGYTCFTESSFSDNIKFKAISRLNEIMAEVNHGQILDMYFEKTIASEADYIEMIGKKTAYLLGGSFELGAIFAGHEDSRSFFRYGYNLGTAFQIMDDLMDIDTTKSKGNTFASDIRKGKRTLMVIKAMETTEGEALAKIMSQNTKTEREISQAVNILNESGSVLYAKRTAQNMIDCAKEEIKKINPKNKDFFMKLADYIIERDI